MRITVAARVVRDAPMYSTPELYTMPRVTTVPDESKIVVSREDMERAFTVSGITAEPTSVGASLQAINSAPKSKAIHTATRTDPTLLASDLCGDEIKEGVIVIKKRFSCIGCRVFARPIASENKNTLGRKSDVRKSTKVNLLLTKNAEPLASAFFESLLVITHDNKAHAISPCHDRCRRTVWQRQSM